MLYTSLNCRIYVPRFYSASIILNSFKNGILRENIVPLVLSRVRNAQPYSGKNITFFPNTAWLSICRWAVQNWSVFVTSLFFIACLPGMSMGMPFIWESHGKHAMG